MVSVVTWNLNSIRSRITHLLAFLEEQKPDILLLQELKLETEIFPYMEIEERGYNCAVHGQKTYNGVAILSKYPLDDITKGLPGNEDDEQARYIEAVASIEGKVMRVASVYVPNGQAVDSEKFPYKLRFLDRLKNHASALLSYEEPLVIGGDYNVAPFPPDVYSPATLDGTVCYHPEERARIRAMMNMGLYDAWRLKHANVAEYSWWDYRAGCFEQDKGMRIDHLLVSPEAADRLKDCQIMRTERAKEKPSDHAPVIGYFQ